MSQMLLLFLLALVLCTSAGCASREKQPKSSVHMYEGEAPTIKYSDQPEAAGGPISSY